MYIIIGLISFMIGFMSAAIVQRHKAYQERYKKFLIEKEIDKIC